MTSNSTQNARFLAVVALAIWVCTLPTLALTAEEMLRDFADDYVQDVTAHPTTFGVRIGGNAGGDWHVAVTSFPEGAWCATVQPLKLVVSQQFHEECARVGRFWNSYRAQVDRRPRNEAPSIGPRA